MKRFQCWAVLFCGLVLAGFSASAGGTNDEGWVSLFNGKDLTGWTPKIRGYPAGENFGETFRVENGVIQVSYDQYFDTFNGRFGHLFYKTPFSNYVLKLEYRFTGKQIPGGPGWAFRNSGIMIHGQTPESMDKNQDFPVSVEVQLLGGNGKNPRSTGNMCSPGTHVVIGGKLIKTHCMQSTSKTYHGDQWVQIEVEAHGNGKIIHRVNGEVVMEYEKPQLDDGDASAKKLIKGPDLMLYGGTISLQSESHPVEFRNIFIRELPAK